MENKSVSAGLPIGWLTMIVLIILKATGNISMGWFWVISSVIWAPLAIILLVVLFITLIAAIVGQL
jgi:hypothetical protein